MLPPRLSSLPLALVVVVALWVTVVIAARDSSPRFATAAHGNGSEREGSTEYTCLVGGADEYLASSAPSMNAVTTVYSLDMRTPNAPLVTVATIDSSEGVFFPNDSSAVFILPIAQYSTTGIPNAWEATLRQLDASGTEIDQFFMGYTEQSTLGTYGADMVMDNNDHFYFTLGYGHGMNYTLLMQNGSAQSHPLKTFAYDPQGDTGTAIVLLAGGDSLTYFLTEDGATTVTTLSPDGREDVFTHDVNGDVLTGQYAAFLDVKSGAATVLGVINSTTQLQLTLQYARHLFDDKASLADVGGHFYLNTDASHVANAMNDGENWWVLAWTQEQSSNIQGRSWIYQLSNDGSTFVEYGPYHAPGTDVGPYLLPALNNLYCYMQMS